MTLIDLLIGGFILPVRYINTYGNPLHKNFCVALVIGESCAMAEIIYSILLMIFTRIYDLKSSTQEIRRRTLFFMLILFWLIFFVFYGVPFILQQSNYLIEKHTSASNVTSYCENYNTSINHPLWMMYIEIVFIYSIPTFLICYGNIRLIQNLCEKPPRKMEQGEYKKYLFRRQMTWHVFLLSIAFLVLWLPWVSIRILITFETTRTIRLVLRIFYYVFTFKSVLFPILYASTNSSFRGSFAIYRHYRIKMNNRVWSVHDNFGYSNQRTKHRF